MYDFLSERTVQSEVIPGVSYTIHAPSYGRRLMFDKATAEFRSSTRIVERKFTKLREAVRADQAAFNSQYGEANAELKKQIEAAADDATKVELAKGLKVFSVTDEQRDQMADLNEESLRLLGTLYNGPRVRIYLKSLDGLTIMGKKADVPMLIEAGPVELFQEILTAIEETSAKVEEEVKNLSLPSISSNQADGKTSDTIATPASEADSSNPETAANIIPIS